MSDFALLHLVSNRRQFFRNALSGMAAGVAAHTEFQFAFHPDLYAQPNSNPDNPMRELLAGNQRFASNQLTSIEHDLAILKEHTADKQEPFAAVLACADSRVPVELIFDQTIGHIFVTRVAGNMVTP